MTLLDKMKILFFMITCGFMLSCFEVSAEDVQNLQNECAEDEDVDEDGECRPIKFRRLPSYENSVIVDPIERDFPITRPSSHESSFYEQMTR